MNLRVLYIARAPFVSGAERALLSMLRHRPAHITPAVVLGHSTQLSNLLHDLQIPTFQIPLPKRSWEQWFAWRKSLRQLKKFIADFQPHLLHANDVPSAQAMSVLGHQLCLPRIVHIRWAVSASELAWWTPQGCDTIISISQWVQDQLLPPQSTQTLPAPLANAKLAILPDAVDWPASPLHVNPPTTSTSHSPTPPKSTTGPISLGFAGQLIPAKGLELLFNAISQLPAPHQPRLLIAGEDTQTQGRYKTHLQTIAQKLNITPQIQWLGFLQNVADLYKQIDAVVCPSLVEPLGLVPLEAAQYAIPSFVNHVGGLAQTVLDQKTGFLIQPTIDHWAQTLQHAHQNRHLLPTMGLAAYHHTAQNYHPNLYWQKLLTHYPST